MNTGGYNPKDLNFGSQARTKLVKGIDKIANAVKSTLGPRGNTVLMESTQHTHGITVTKDGVTVAKAIELLDPVENLAVRMMKEAADKTATMAGDGTTTAIVLTEALVKEAMHKIKDTDNKTEVLRELVELTKEMCKHLKKKSRPLNEKRLHSVATISANNDAFIGGIISDVYKKIGQTGIVTVENSKSSKTYSKTTSGIKIDRGYSNPLFINNHKKDECILENTHVLVSDKSIENILSIESILKPIISEGKRLLIIAPCGQNVLNTLAANVMKNNLKVCVIQPPNFGYKQHELMQDIALSVGATYFSEKTGDDLSIVSFDDLGHASKVIVGRDSTVVLSSEKEEEHAKVIEDRVAQLWDAHKITETKEDKEFVMSRIASLTGGVGVIYVGGNTDLEQKELYDRVDDAVCAVRSAMSEGILPGAGKALFNASFAVTCKNSDSDSKKIASAILSKAIRTPLKQILINAGKSCDKIYNTAIDEKTGYDVKSDVMCDLVKKGIIDPTKVTKSALQNAVSVAVTILSTNAIITMARSYETQ